MSPFVFLFIILIESLVCYGGLCYCVEIIGKGIKYGYLNYAYDLKMVPNLCLRFKCSSSFVDALVVLI